MAEDAELGQLVARKSESLKNQDFFEALGVPRNASPQAVQAAYFQLAKQLHPDRLARTSLSPEELTQARRVFEFVTEAFKVLSDPEKREQLLRSQESGKGNPFAQNNSAERMITEEAKIFYHKGQKLLKMRAWGQAEQFLRKAVEKDPNDANYLTALGWCSFNNTERAEASRFEEAKRLWSQALEREPKAGLTLYYLSLYHKAMGETSKQRQLLESALRADSSLVDAQREMRLLDMRLDRDRGSKGAKGFLAGLFPSLTSKKRKA
jgi:curved DNA-binding protein CbpA